MRRCMHHDWPLDEKQCLLLYQSGAATVLVLEATKLWAGHSRISRAEVTSIMQCICFPAGDSPYLESVQCHLPRGPRWPPPNIESSVSIIRLFAGAPPWS